MCAVGRGSRSLLAHMSCKHDAVHRTDGQSYPHGVIYNLFFCLQHRPLYSCLETVAERKALSPETVVF